MLQQVPVEIQVQILNNLVFFYNSTTPITNENEYYHQASRKYKQYNEQEKIHTTENIHVLCQLCQVNKQWYELITHQRMNRLWKCAYVQMGGTIVDVNKMKKTNTMTLTHVVYNECKKRYLLEMYHQRYDELKKLISSKYDTTKCIEYFKNINWIIGGKENSTMETVYLKLGFTPALWEVIIYISQNHEELLTYGNFFVIATQRTGATKHYENFFKIINNMKQENVEKLFQQSDNTLSAAIINTSDNNFKLLSPVVSKYYISYSDTTRYQYDILQVYYDNILNPIPRMECICQCIGQEEFETLCSVVIPVICSYKLDYSTIDDTVSLIRSIKYEQRADTLLHSLIQRCGTTFSHLPKLIAKHKDLFAPMTIIRDTTGKLPIEHFILLFSSIRRGTRHMDRMDESQRISVIDTLFKVCPDVKIYKKHKIGDLLLTMIVQTGDDKKKYTKYL
jgi:hypothetical protein